MKRTPLLVLTLATVLLGTACAGPPRPTPAHAPLAAGGDTRARIVATAEAQIGTPYRYGGATPGGFDCSGLVQYSYERAGIRGLPRSAAALADMSRPVSLDRVEPGDLLFFKLGSKKARHVGIYVGDRSFVHAPSSGKRVERVSFDHVYWRRHLKSAGRVLR